MISYDPRLSGGQGNLANAVGLWNQFFGPASKQNAANLAQTQQATQQSAQLFPAQLKGAQAQSDVQSRQADLDRNTQAAQQAASGLTDKDFNAGFDPSNPISQSNPRFWSQLGEDEQRHVQKTFALNSTKAGNPVTNGAVVPDIYDAWMGRQANVMPPIRLPMGGFPGTGGGQPVDQTKTSVGGPGFHQVPELSLGADGSPRFTLSRIPNDLTDADRKLIHDDPVNAPAMFPELQRPAAESFAKNIGANLDRYQTAVTKDPAIQTYLSGSGEQAGLLPTWQDIDNIRQKHLDANGNFTGDLSPQEATTLIFRVAHMDNPGSIVRDSTWEQVLKGSPILDQWKAALTGAATGQRVPAVTLKGLYGLADSLKSSSEQRAYGAAAGWEPELQQHGLELGDVIHNKSFVDSYRQQNPASVAPSPGTPAPAAATGVKENPVPVKSQEEFSNLAPGTWYRDSAGTVALKGGTPKPAATKSGAPATATLPPTSPPLAAPVSLSNSSQFDLPQGPGQLPPVSLSNDVWSPKAESLRRELQTIDKLPAKGRTPDVLQRRAQILKQLVAH